MPQLYRWAAFVAAATACAVVGLSGCRSRAASEIEVEVRGVSMDQTTGAPVVVLQDKEHRTGLPIWIGPAEAQAIALEIQGVSPPRPMTHDLMKNVLDEAGVALERVVISGLQESTYLAQLHLRAGRRDLRVDSRPSDAIALAVRFKKPIFVSRALLQRGATIDLQRIHGADTVRLRGITVQALSAELAAHFDIEPGRGVLVAAVDGGRNGLERGDVVVAVNGGVVSGLSDFREKLVALGAAPVELAVRRGAQRLTVALAAETD